jgi:methionyl-tRNA formyltransferase
MRLAIIGQQDFGKAVLDAFLARGDQVAAVFCAPDKAGAKPDVLKTAALENGVPVHQFASLRSAEARSALAGAQADLGIMAYVLQFAPQDFVTIPRLGTIQYHPSLLPRYRGPSSINWPIICGDTQTGLSIFRPTDGLDEGPVILQKTARIGPDDTLGTVYFERLFPQGVAAMLEAADQVFEGRHREWQQDESQASYQGWCRDAEAQIHWAQPVDAVYDLIRGCNPAPGAWTTAAGARLQIFDARKVPVRTFGAVRGRIGEVVEAGAGGFQITTQGGRIEVLRARLGDGKKVASTELLASGAIKAGMILGI